MGPTTVRIVFACFTASAGVMSCPLTEAAQAQELPVPVLQGRATLVIGDVFGPEESSFGKVSSVVGTPDGRVLVADFQASTVRAFGPDGSYQLTVAGPGQGPEEVSGPCCLAFAPDGLLWIRDTGNARYGVFQVAATDSRPVRTVRMVHAHAGMWVATSFTGDTLVDVGAEVQPGMGPALRRFLRAPDGRLVRMEHGDQPTVAELGHKQLRTSAALLYLVPPFGPRYLTAHGPGGVWAEVVTSRPEVRLRDRAGRVRKIETGFAEGPPLSAEERRAAGEEIARQRRRARGQARSVEWTVPERKQPVETLFFDEAGRLWVQRSTPPGAPAEANVYDGEGRLVERRTWPAGITIGLLGWAGGSWSLGVRQDEIGVEQVVRLEWTMGE